MHALPPPGFQNYINGRVRGTLDRARYQTGRNHRLDTSSRPYSHPVRVGC